MRKKNELEVFLLGSMGVAQTGSYVAISKIHAAYFRKEDAETHAQMENEFGLVIIDGRKFKQTSVIFPAKVGYSKSLKKIWVAWSNAFSKDGSGAVYMKLLGVWTAEHLALKAKEEHPKESTIEDHLCDIKTEIAFLEVRDKYEK